MSESSQPSSSFARPVLDVGAADSFAPDEAKRPESPGGSRERQIALRLGGLRCKGCGQRAEALLRRLPGVTTATVWWRKKRAEVRYDTRRTSEHELTTALAQAGYDVGPAAARGPRTTSSVDLAIALVAFANVVMLATARPAPRVAAVAQLALAAVALMVAGSALGRRAVALLRRGILDRDALALAASAAAFALGVRDLAAYRHAPCGGLAALGVRFAPRPPEPGSGFAAATGIALAALAARLVEDTLRRHARRTLSEAERVARGERGAALDAEVGAVLARVAEAEASPPEGSWDDAAARGIITAALGCASFALVTHCCLGGTPLGPLAIASAVAVLVVASPAALLVAAPAARAIAVLRARAGGVLVKDPDALLALAAVDVACLEKNGALGSDALAVRDLVWAPGVEPDPALIADVAALEQLAAHPAGRAIAAHLAGAGVAPTPLGPDARVAETPTGVAGRVRGALVEIGTAARFGGVEHGAPPDVTVVLFGRNGVAFGRFDLSAPPRAGVAAAVRALAVRGVRPLLLSGDGAPATAIAARRLGVPGFGGLGPSEKALALRDLQLRGARVLFVGDADLDPALGAQADVAIAVAPSALPGAVRAPIVLADDRLDRLPALVDLGRALRAVLRQNAALALIHNAALIPAAALGYVPPLAAAGLALLEGLAVLGNAARLLRRRVA